MTQPELPTNESQPATSTRPRRLQRLLLLILLPILGLYGLSMTAAPPNQLGIDNGQLAKCPDSPNCVATQSGNESQKMAPIAYQGNGEEMLAKIKSTILEQFPRAKLITETETYLHYEFTSLIFRFVDDVEFLVDDRNQVIQFRSASRVGYSDLGANRKRMQSIVDGISP